MTLFDVELERGNQTVRLTRGGGIAEARALAAQTFERFEGELDFAMALGLTRTAQAGQAAVREGLSDRFTVRRQSFLERGIVLDPATKSRPEALIISRDDFLARHEEGGIKEPRQGRSLAIPQPAIVPTSRSIVPQAKRPRRIIESSSAFPVDLPLGGGRTLRVIARRKRRQRSPETERNRRERLGLSGRRTTRRGRRPPGFRSPPRKDDRGLEILYVLTPRAELEGRGFFVPVIEGAIEGTFAEEVANQILRELFLDRGGGGLGP